MSVKLKEIFFKTNKHTHITSEGLGVTWVCLLLRYVFEHLLCAGKIVLCEDAL